MLVVPYMNLSLHPFLWQDKGEEMSKCDCVAYDMATCPVDATTWDMTPICHRSGRLEWCSFTLEIISEDHCICSTPSSLVHAPTRAAAQSWGRVSGKLAVERNLTICILCPGSCFFRWTQLLNAWPTLLDSLTACVGCGMMGGHFSFNLFPLWPCGQGWETCCVTVSEERGQVFIDVSTLMSRFKVLSLNFPLCLNVRLLCYYYCYTLTLRIAQVLNRTYS